VLQGGRNGGQPPCGDSCCGESLTLDISVCLAGFAGVPGAWALEGLRASDTRAPQLVCAGMLGETVKEGWDWLSIFLLNMLHK
jgi:hypothetical protein